MNSHSLQERAFVHAENYFININLRKVFHALLILIISICTTQSSSGQQPSEPATISPGGVFDQVFDRFGLSTDLSHLAISEGVNFEDHSVGSCASNSIFDFYFESGSGFEDDQDQEHLDRRSILCGLGEDLSDFITISNPTIRINIWVRDFSSLDTAITGISAGSSYYLVPSSSQVTGASITEGAVWNTIKSGADIYRSIVPSTYDPNKVVNSNGEFFHGYIAFDFSQPYHADYTATPTGDYDLYTIALKELTHALGMASLIGEDGNSVFPSGYNYYSRYDTFLETQSNSPLITSTGNCTGYNYSFNPALNAATLLDPEGTCSGNPTISCGLSVHFGGTANQDVYTPSCFQPGLSLSHFVDQCHDPNAYNSGEYYVLSAETFTGPLFQKRYLKEEERLALSDIGYTLAASYGSTGHGNSMTYYGAPGPLITVVGVNDGLTSISTYAYFGQTGSQLTIDDCLGNDAGSPTVLECAEVVIGNGAIALSGNSILYTPDVNTGGVHVLRYVPKLGSQKGTITYVIIYTYLGGCGTVCDLVGNGGFENGNVTCVPSMTYFGTQINCWLPGTSTPGYFGAGCGTTTLDIPTGGTYYSNVPIDSWNGTGNQNFMGLWAQNNSGGQDEESIQTILGTPLIPGNYYILSFYAQVAGSNFFAMIDANIAIGISTTSLPYVGNPFDYNQPGITQITGSQPIVVSETPSAFNNGWHLVEYPFIYNGPPNQSNLIIAYNVDLMPINNESWFVFIDDVSLTPAVFIEAEQPNPVCINEPVELTAVGADTYAWSPTNSTDPDVGEVVVATTDSNVTITLIGTDENGCVSSADYDIEVEDCCQGLEVSAIVGNTCSDPINAYIDLVLSDTDHPYEFSWVGPGTFTASTEDIEVSVNGTYTVTVTLFGEQCADPFDIIIANVMDCYTAETISTSVAWNGETRYYCGDVTITPAGMLSILNGSDIHFNEGFGIIMQPGAVLYMDNGSILTNNEFCDKMWKGISCDYTSNFGSTPDQTEIRMINDCEVSNAESAIYLHIYDAGLESLTGSCYFVSCTDSRFLNNTNDFTADFDIDTRINCDANFNSCDFRIDDQYLNLISPTTRISLQRALGVTLNGSSIVNEVPDILETQGLIGIGAAYSNFFLYGCNDQGSECSKISGFTYGIRASSIHTGLLSVVDRMDFECYRGIFVNIPSSVQFYRNTFDDMPAGFTLEPYGAFQDVYPGAYGIYTYGAGRIDIQENEFIQNEYNGNYGCIVNDGGAYNNKVYNNTFRGQDRALNLYNRNRSASSNPGPTTIGLQYGCNQFLPDENNVQNEIDVFVYTEPNYQSNSQRGVKPFQVYIDPNLQPSISAGNEFTQVQGTWPNDDMQNNDSQHIDYFYYTGDNLDETECAPIGAWTFHSTADQNECASETDFFSGGGNNARVELEQSIEINSTALNEIVDGGDTELLTNEIVNTTFSDALETYYSLLQVSPNLSETVMIEAIKKEFDLPAALLTEILKSNPTAMKSDRIALELDQRIIPLEQYQMEEIQQALNIISEKEQLECTISALMYERDQLILQEITQVNRDSTIVNKWEAEWETVGEENYIQD